MRLTTFTDYTLRVLIYLALQENRLTTIAEIADAYDISKNHLMKVVHFLALEGYLETIRGKGGGVRLKRLPATINLGAIVRKTEADTALVECFRSDGSDCVIATGCLLRGVFNQARQAFYQVLDGYTLASVLRNGEHLKGLFDIEQMA